MAQTARRADCLEKQMETLLGQMSTNMEKLETISAMLAPSPVTKRKTKPTRARHASIPEKNNLAWWLQDRVEWQQANGKLLTLEDLRTLRRCFLLLQTRTDSKRHENSFKEGTNRLACTCNTSASTESPCQISKARTRLVPKSGTRLFLARFGSVPLAQRFMRSSKRRHGHPKLSP